MTIHQRSVRPGNVLAVTSLLAFPLFIIPAAIFRDGIGLRALNVAASTIVLVHGLAVLRLMWTLERRKSPGAVPFATCFFIVQHLAFGLGGFLASAFDDGYCYINGHGLYEWDEAILPFLLVNMVTLTAGLGGVWMATRNSAGERSNRLPRGWLSETLYWDAGRYACYVSLAMHAVVWILASRAQLLGVLGYPIQAFSYCQNATFLLWGVSWPHCTKKWLFLTYLSIFATIEMISGNRTFFMFPIITFGMGLLVSGSIRKWKFSTALKFAPLAILLMWAFLKSEDVRMIFSRGNPINAEDAVARLESLADTGTSNAIDTQDGRGRRVNRAFRLGGRLFELSAADVISRTPSSIPYWGWSSEDWSALVTGFLPAKLVPGAFASASEGSGIFFLRSYGWYIDPFGETGASPTSMPATMEADAWRRFGWAGVVGTFFLWAWLLATGTSKLRFGPDQIGLAIFSSALLGEVAFMYPCDLIYVVDSLPRRMAVIGVYTALIMVLTNLLRVREGGRRAGRSPRPTVVLVDVAVIERTRLIPVEQR